MDHRRADGRALPPVAIVEVLDHLLTALMLEIDVNIGRFVAAFGNEAGEEQPDLGRVHRGDAEAVADHGIGRRAAALAQDSPVPGEFDDVVDGEEVAGVIELADQVEFVGEGSLDRLRDTVRVA